MFRRRNRSSDRVPVFEFVRSRLDEAGRLVDSDVDLPDEEPTTPGGIRFAPGAMDGAFGHHGGGGADSDRAAAVGKVLVQAANSASDRDFRMLYAAVSDSDVLGFVDPLLEHLAESSASTARVREVARRLARESPDRAPVKVGLALLGACGLEPPDVQVVRVLGAHDEFTLYAAVALSNGLEDPESELWALAATVDGWGRIQCVERLRHTTDPQIKRWMLLEGYKNSVMYEYLAYTCADTGGLLAALREQPLPSRALLSAAGDLIQALIAGGPAEDMSDYDDGVDVVEAYLEIMDRAAERLDDLLTAVDIARFAASAPDNDGLLSKGWSTTRSEALQRAAQSIVERPTWRTAVEEGLAASDDAPTWWRADTAAKALGIDTFDATLRRIEADPLGHDWFGAWEQADGARAAQLVDLARALLPLDRLQDGPTDSLGLGPEFRVHQALDWTLQALRGFPGVGGDLVELGLTSSVVRNRNMSLNALSSWPTEAWPSGAIALVRQVGANDSNEKTRDLARELAARWDGAATSP